MVRVSAQWKQSVGSLSKDSTEVLSWEMASRARNWWLADVMDFVVQLMRVGIEEGRNLRAIRGLEASVTPRDGWSESQPVSPKAREIGRCGQRGLFRFAFSETEQFLMITMSRNVYLETMPKIKCWSMLSDGGIRKEGWEEGKWWGKEGGREIRK